MGFEMSKKKFFISIVVLFYAANIGAKLANPHLADNITKTVAMSRIIKQEMLPKPYDYLLSQPLMTLGIETYYQRIPIIQTIFAKQNRQNNSYSRIIIMLVDSNKTRNDATKALERNEQVPVELALITMNFNELPQHLIHDVLHSNIPFGKLLIKHHIKTSSSNRRYFVLDCNKTFASLIHCKLNSKLYGRTNTLNHAGNKKWVARMIEILPVAN